MSHIKSSTFNAAVNLAKYCIGAGILALPYATSRGGLLFSPIMIGAIALWNSIACEMMMDCKKHCLGVTFPSDISSTYSKIAYAGCGTVGVMVTDFSILVTLIGVCIAYQITFATLLYDVPDNMLSNTTLTVLSGLIAYPISCARNLDALSSFSLVGLVCLIVGIVAILLYGFAAYGVDMWNNPLTGMPIRPTTQPAAELPMWPESVADMTSFIGVSIFCFDICSLAFPIEESMESPHEIGKAVLMSLGFVWILYVILGNVGAMLYIHDASKGIADNILSNLPPDSYTSVLVRVSMACVSLLTFPLTLAPAAQMVEHGITKIILRNSYQCCTCTNSTNSEEVQTVHNSFTSRFLRVLSAFLWSSGGTHAESHSVSCDSISVPNTNSRDDLCMSSSSYGSVHDAIEIDHRTEQRGGGAVHDRTSSDTERFVEREARNNDYIFRTGRILYDLSTVQHQSPLQHHLEMTAVATESNISVIDGRRVARSQQHNFSEYQGNNPYDVVNNGECYHSEIRGAADTIDRTPWVILFMTRLLLVTLTTVVAAYVPCFSAVISLLGGFTVAIVCFVLPPLLHLRIVSLKLNPPAHQLLRPTLNTVQSDTVKEPHCSYRPVNCVSDRTDVLYEPADDDDTGNVQLPHSHSTAWYLQSGVVIDTGFTVIGVAVCVFATTIITLEMFTKYHTGTAC